MQAPATSTTGGNKPDDYQGNEIAPTGLRCTRMLNGMQTQQPQQSRLKHRRDARGTSPSKPESLEEMARFVETFQQNVHDDPEDWFNEDHSRFFENIEDIQEIADAITAVGIVPLDPVEPHESSFSSRLTRRKAEAERRISTQSDQSVMDDVLALMPTDYSSPQSDLFARRPSSPRRMSPRVHSPVTARSPQPTRDLHSPTQRARSPSLSSPNRRGSPKIRRQSTDQENANLPTTPKSGRKSFDTQKGQLGVAGRKSFDALNSQPSNGYESLLHTVSPTIHDQSKQLDCPQSPRLRRSSMDPTGGLTLSPNLDRLSIADVNAF